MIQRMNESKKRTSFLRIRRKKEGKSQEIGESCVRRKSWKMGPGEEGEVGQEGAGGGKAECRKTEGGRRRGGAAGKMGVGTEMGGQAETAPDNRR